jgi:hypothetical protein
MLKEYFIESADVVATAPSSVTSKTSISVLFYVVAIAAAPYSATSPTSIGVVAS